MEAEKSKIKVLADFIFDENLLPSSLKAVLLCPHVEEEAREFSGISFIRIPIPFIRVPLS